MIIAPGPVQSNPCSSGSREALMLRERLLILDTHDRKGPFLAIFFLSL